MTPLEFVDKLMVTIERLEGFREIDKRAAQRQMIRDDPPRTSGPYNLDNSSITTFGSAQSASNIPSSWSRPILPLMNDDERPKRRAVSAQPSPTEPVDPAVGSVGGRIVISAMAGLLQLPMLRRAGSSVGGRTLRRSNTIDLPVPPSVGLSGEGGLSKLVNNGRKSCGEIAT